ncbi:MAG: isoprenoid biosynthesis glyoxalase ElbB [bacterium]|nr:isoprenoid biosynthesis glyoxalase ElbB [bacterium]
MTRVAVILSGCGVFDGSEIHEAVLTLLYLDRAGVETHCYAPDKNQMHVVNHLTQTPAEGETRNVLVESARIARGEIKALAKLRADEYDAVIFPGGFGAAKNLCGYAAEGDACSVDLDVNRVVLDAHAKGVVIGAICISPVTIARALQDKGANPVLTIGSDAATAGSLRAMGAVNEPHSVSEIAVDAANRIVSTPAYMLGPSIAHVASGIEKLVNEVLKMAKAKA